MASYPVTKNSSNTQNRGRKEVKRKWAGYTNHGRVMLLAKLDPQLFQELTAAHITRYLDLHKLDEFLSGAPNDKDHGKKNPLRLLRLGSSSSKEEHKHPIEVSSDTLNSVCKLVRSLNNAKDLSIEGLFRKSGNLARQQQLMEELQYNSKMDLSAQFVHDRACVLKQLISQLPEPLLLSRHFEAFSQAINLKDNSIESGHDRCLRVMQLLFLRLPRNNLTLLKSLLPFLHAVAAEPANLMDANNLAKLFAPHFLIVKNHPMDQALLEGMLQTAIDVVAFIIREAQQMFNVPADFLREAVTRLQLLEKNDPDGGRLSTGSTGSASSMENCPSPMLAYAPASSEETTQLELAKLAEHINSLPEPKRSKLREQLLGAKAMVEAARSSKAPITPTGRQRSKSLSSSIKKRLPFFGSNKKRHLSCEAESPLQFAMHTDYNKIDENASPASILIATEDLSFNQNDISKVSRSDKKPYFGSIPSPLNLQPSSHCTPASSDSASLPVCEKQLSEKRCFSPANRRILFPVVSNSSSPKYTTESPRKEHLSRSRGCHTSHKTVCSPTSRETAL